MISKSLTCTFRTFKAAFLLENDSPSSEAMERATLVRCTCCTGAKAWVEVAKVATTAREIFMTTMMLWIRAKPLHNLDVNYHLQGQRCDEGGASGQLGRRIYCVLHVRLHPPILVRMPTTISNQTSVFLMRRRFHWFAWFQRYAKTWPVSQLHRPKSTNGFEVRDL